ncbi:MAG TPA: SOS response-associated peptidase [Chloroflexota bacterium]|nr:SOS response-associated peptidase [Chloroflexota bacterium]
MCGRFTLTNIGQISLRFDVDTEGEQLTPRFNVAPSQQVPVIVGTARGHALRWMRWGYPPARRVAEVVPPPPINARAETLLDRPLFRQALTLRRCLIPADGFYEWQQLPSAHARQPYYIRLRSGEVFAFAGIYAESRDAEGRPAPGCAIITTAPNSIMAPIHQRMPAILERTREVDWLDPNLTAGPAILGLLHPYPPAEMEAYPVSSLVSTARNEGPELIRPSQLGPMLVQAAMFT